MPTIGWSASSAKATCCIASKPGPSTGRRVGPPAGAHGGSTRSHPIASSPATIADPDDRAISDQLLAELRRKTWVDISADIIVRDWVVHLWFSDEQPREERLTFRVAAENIPGVRRVEEHLVGASPDSLGGQR